MLHAASQCNRFKRNGVKFSFLTWFALGAIVPEKEETAERHNKSSGCISSSWNWRPCWQHSHAHTHVHTHMHQLECNVWHGEERACVWSWGLADELLMLQETHSSLSCDPNRASLCPLMPRLSLFAPLPFSQSHCFSPEDEEKIC